jgi:DNA-binding NarL/FixJ family response regulator
MWSIVRTGMDAVRRASRQRRNVHGGCVVLNVQGRAESQIGRYHCRRHGRGAFGRAPLNTDVPIALSARELEILRLLVQGLANKEIANSMAISESAVKNTLQQLFGKTAVHTRSQLVRVALERYRNRL